MKKQLSLEKSKNKLELINIFELKQKLTGGMMKNFNKLNFETRFKELETKKFYRVTSIDFDEKVVTGIAIGGKEEKLFPMEKVRLSAFTRFYDRKNRKIFENMLVIAKLEDSSLLGSVINTRGIWCIYD